MLDAGGGGGGGGTSGTPWHGISIEAMWQWVNRDLSPHYSQGNSWKKASELTGLYQLRLQTFRDRLAQSWNPQTSTAAQTYLTKLDELITAVRNVDEVAGRNYQASVDIPGAIFEAKMRLEPIYRRYQSAQSAYNAGARPPDGEPLPQDNMNDAHIEAVSVMRQLGSSLSAARTSLGPPQPYVSPVPRSRNDSGGDYGGGSGGAMPPPMIPPVVPMAPPPPGPGPMPSMPPPRGPELVQAGPPSPVITPPPPGPGPMPGPGPTPPPVGPVPPTGVIKPPPGPAPVQPGPGRPNMPGRPTGPIITGPIGGPPGKGPTTGLIGGQPPAGKGPIGARPNPVGGMIGSPASGANRTGAAGAGIVGRPGGPGAAAVGGVGGRGPVGTPGAAGVAGTAGRGGTGSSSAGRGAAGAMGVAGRLGRRDDEDGEHFDPDTMWEVAQGVTPVLDAPEKQGPIDPGPAIGLNR